MTACPPNANEDSSEFFDATVSPFLTSLWYRCLPLYFFIISVFLSFIPVYNRVQRFEVAEILFRARFRMS
jgi:hypothetical protein